MFLAVEYALRLSNNLAVGVNHTTLRVCSMYRWKGKIKKKLEFVVCVWFCITMWLFTVVDFFLNLDKKVFLYLLNIK